MFTAITFRNIDSTLQPAKGKMEIHFPSWKASRATEGRNFSQVEAWGIIE